MSFLDGILNNKLLTIRNLLITITLILMSIVVIMVVFQIGDASTRSSEAEQDMAVNAVSDDLAQLSMSVATKRTVVNTAFGFAGVPDSDLVRQATIQNYAIEGAYDSAMARIQSEIPDYPTKQADVSALRDAYNSYAELQDSVESDLSAVSESRELRARTVRNNYNNLINAASSIRGNIEANFASKNPSVAAVAKLKYQLWVMIEYASQESASIGAKIASGEKFDVNDLSINASYGGYLQGAWAQVQNITSSELVNDDIKALVDTIANDFMEVFTYETKDAIYGDSDGYEDGEFVEYSMTAVEWVETANAAASPINEMGALADTLARELNESAVSSATMSMTMSFTLLVGVGAIAILSFWVVIVRVVRPVNALSGTMMTLSDGNLDVEVPNADRVDEVGDMARSVQIFKENAVERMKLEEEQRQREEDERRRKEEEEETKRREEEERRVREEEQERQAREERRQAMLDLADQFEASVMEVVEGVSRSAAEMESAARGMATTAEETSKQTDVVSNASQQASSNAQMVASAAEELSASVREITGQTNQSSAAARDAVTRTETASTDIAELVNAAQKIGDVVKLINDIAEQTNLLALNATIEAARAGDAGKGFAVVASEVKSLANQTARATSEISEQVEGMQTATNTAVKAMDQIKDIISDIDSTAVSIASAVEEQDASTQEIARNVAEVSTGTEEVTSIIHDVSDGAASTGSAATEVLGAAQLLTQQSSDLRNEVENFLSTVRS